MLDHIEFRSLNPGFSSPVSIAKSQSPLSFRTLQFANKPEKVRHWQDHHVIYSTYYIRSDDMIRTFHNLTITIHRSTNCFLLSFFVYSFPWLLCSPIFYTQFHAHNATTQKLPVLGFYSKSFANKWVGGLERKRERERGSRLIYMHLHMWVHTCKLPMPIWLDSKNDHFPYQTKGTRPPFSLADNNLIIYLHPQSTCPSISAIPGFSDKAKPDTWAKSPAYDNDSTKPLSIEGKFSRILDVFLSSPQPNHTWYMLFLLTCPVSYLAHRSYLFNCYLYLPHPP